MTVSDMPRIRRRMRQLRPLGFLLLPMVLLIALGQAAKRNVSRTPTEKIGLGEKAGLAEIAAQRKSQIKELLRLVQNARTEIEPLLLALEALGKLRATEAAGDLVPLLGGEPMRLTRGMANRLDLPYEEFPKVLEDTVVAIGLPCREPILRQLGELHGPVVPGTTFPKKAILAHGWAVVPSEVEHRRRLVQALRRIEGQACAVFLVKGKLATEKDERRRENLKKALDLLGASQKKKPTTAPTSPTITLP